MGLSVHDWVRRKLGASNSWRKREPAAVWPTPTPTPTVRNSFLQKPDWVCELKMQNSQSASARKTNTARAGPPPKRNGIPEPGGRRSGRTARTSSGFLGDGSTVSLTQWHLEVGRWLLISVRSQGIWHFDQERGRAVEGHPYHWKPQQ